MTASPADASRNKKSLGGEEIMCVFCRAVVIQKMFVVSVGWDAHFGQIFIVLSINIDITEQ